MTRASYDDYGDFGGTNIYFDSRDYYYDDDTDLIVKDEVLIELQRNEPLAKEIIDPNEIRIHDYG